MSAPVSTRAPRRQPRLTRTRRGPRTLSLDIGGTRLKAGLLDDRGALLEDQRHVPTPRHAGPRELVNALVDLVAPFAGYDRIAAGFPGIVLHGVVYSFPVTGDARYRGLRLAEVLERRLGAPARVLNDAALQGLGAITGKGVEMVITLGTGLGTALFIDGELGTHFELLPPWPHRAPRGGWYGSAAMRQLGQREWSRRVLALVAALRHDTNFQRIYIGGGNASHLTGPLPRDAALIGNPDALRGGVRVWQWNLGR